MKLIIDIPEDLYRDILSREAEIREKGYVIEGAVLLATPLDDVKED